MKGNPSVEPGPNVKGKWSYFQRFNDPNYSYVVFYKGDVEMFSFPIVEDGPQERLTRSIAKAVRVGLNRSVC